jgi:hypothetical protein
MRNFVLGLAAAGAVTLMASPATAQYYPGYGYGYSRDYGPRYNGYGDFGALQRRLYNVERSLDGVPPQAAYQLNAEANALERRLRIASRNGLNPYEARDLDVRIGQLERRLQWASNQGYRYNNYSYGYRGERHRYHDRDDD